MKQLANSKSRSPWQHRTQLGAYETATIEFEFVGRDLEGVL